MDAMGRRSGHSSYSQFSRVARKVVLTIQRTTSSLDRSRRLGEIESSPLRRFARAALIGLPLIASAALLSMEVAARSHPWLAWITLIPLLAAVRVLTPRNSLFCGALWGSSFFAFLASAQQPVVEPTLTAFALLTGAPAIFAFAAAWFTRRFGFNPLILGAGWAGVELALIPLGLGGGLLAGPHSEAAGAFGGVLYQVFGYVCLAAFITAANGLLVAILSRACVAIGGSRSYIRGVAGNTHRVFRSEVPVWSLLPVTSARPRAPPAL